MIATGVDGFAAAGPPMPVKQSVLMPAHHWSVGAGTPQHRPSSQKDGPDHLGLRCNARPEHRMALITSGLRALQSCTGRRTGTVLPQPPSHNIARFWVVLKYTSSQTPITWTVARCRQLRAARRGPRGGLGRPGRGARAVRHWLLPCVFALCLHCVCTGFVLCVCPVCLPCVFALRVCPACLPCVFALCVCPACLPCVFALCVCPVCLPCVFNCLCGYYDISLRAPWLCPVCCPVCSLPVWRRHLLAGSPQGRAYMDYRPT